LKQFACGDVVPGCKTVFTADSEEAILTQVAGHAQRDHGLTEIPTALVDQVRSKIHDQPTA